MIRSVLFDLGNVLMRFEPMQFWKALKIEDTRQREQTGPHVLELGRSYESGDITTTEFRERLGRLFGGRFSGQQLDEAFLSVLPAPVTGAEDLVARVAQRCETALVSNTNPLHLGLCLRETPALRHIDRIYASYRLGAMKPDPLFYTRVIEGEGYAAGDMIFIDDLPDNIEGARRSGFNAIRFSGPQDLERALADRRLL